MTEGGISEWKVKEGEAFTAGAVLLSIETDKASIDVEAQDDGVMGKIFVGDGAAGIPVGKLIAILAEEGDDLANIELPAEEPAASSGPSPADSKPEAAPTASTPADAPTPSPATPSPVPSALHAHPTHDKPLLPSVLRVLALAGITDTSAIKATGHHGILTKGDVLAHIGKISNPRGSLPKEKPDYGHPAHEYTATPKDVKKPVEVLLDGPAIRRLVTAGLGSAGVPKPAFKEVPVISFDSILDDYLPPSQRSSPVSSLSSSASPVPPPPAARKSAFDDILGL
ncbi:pyridoxine biosynthesis protein [Rhodotorula kratochvilovae]